MDINRATIREGQEIIQQHQNRQQTLSPDELKEDNLGHLLAFIRQLARTPPGAAELKRRTAVFGECRRIRGETSGQFHARLRHWLDRDLPQTNSHGHAPRHTDC